MCVSERERERERESERETEDLVVAECEQEILVVEANVPSSDVNGHHFLLRGNVRNISGRARLGREQKSLMET